MERAEILELSASVLQALYGNPMCFIDLCKHFGISTERGADDAFSNEYCDLLEAVDMLQPVGPGKRVATAIRRGEKDYDRKFVLYRLDEEARLKEWGLRKPSRGDIQEDSETATS